MEANPIINNYRGPSEVENERLKKPVPVGVGSGSEPAANGCFDCNICLDFAVDPVVTLCGHLYCWPCIYKWLRIEPVPVSPQQCCPVCKAALSPDSLVPLYGRGRKRSSHPETLNVPRRPNVAYNRVDPLSDGVGDSHPQTPVSSRHHRYPTDSVFTSAPASPTRRVIHSTAGGVLGGMAVAVLPWVLRNHQEAVTGMQLASPSPYYLASPRLRRQEMEVESSLRQIWLFLFCCAMLCLLLF